MKKFCSNKIRKLHISVSSRFQALTYNNIKNLLISLFITFIIINTSFCLLYYIYDYNPSLYIRAFINIFCILPISRCITSKTYGGNYSIKNGKEKGKILYAVIHYFKTSLYSYTFSVVFIYFGISEVVYIPLISFMVLTLLTMDIQILGSPDYCMGPNEERSLTVGNNTSSEKSVVVAESSSSLNKRTHSEAFSTSLSQLEERQVERIRKGMYTGDHIVKYLPDRSIEDNNAPRFTPDIRMLFNRVPAEIPPTVSLAITDKSSFWANIQSKYTNTEGDITDCPFTYSLIEQSKEAIGNTGYIFKFTGDYNEQKQQSIELLIFLYQEASEAYSNYAADKSSASNQSEYYKWLHRYLACRHHHQYTYLLTYN